MSKKPETFAIRTFGCKVNAYESQAIRERLAERGLREVPCTTCAPDCPTGFPDGFDVFRPATAPTGATEGPASHATGAHDAGTMRRCRPDIVIVNTCVVTGTAERRSLRALREARAMVGPGGIVAAVGCMADHPSARKRAARYADICLGNSRKAYLASILGLPQPIQAIQASASISAVSTPSPEMGISRFEGRTRAFVKVQDGCDQRCSYCIIPAVRGRSRSRNPAEVLDEIARLLDAGYREIVITGIHLGAYGKDLLPSTDLVHLCERICSMRGEFRIRLSSIEIVEISDSLLDLMASSPKLCPHLHVPLQSGDDGVLKAMRRPYTAGRFLATVARIRSSLDAPGLSTDIIYGFPGETEAAFENTLSVVREAGFTRLHVFPFSPRGGTDAARLPGRIGRAGMARRGDILARLAAEAMGRAHREWLGREAVVLVESERDRKTGLPAGYSERYARVLIEGAGPEICGRFVKVRLSGMRGECILGRLQT
ncbi:MAG: MiaB/RimO family radical SAM methylthiotransferase [Planctomycetota bacterium]|nr:MiaB/RimO family radical SAM methylthiotransferase [Planctomycetota bacterium]